MAVAGAGPSRGGASGVLVGGRRPGPGRPGGRREGQGQRGGPGPRRGRRVSAQRPRPCLWHRRGHRPGHLPRPENVLGRPGVASPVRRPLTPAAPGGLAQQLRAGPWRRPSGAPVQAVTDTVLLAVHRHGSGEEDDFVALDAHLVGGDALVAVGVVEPHAGLRLNSQPCQGQRRTAPPGPRRTPRGRRGGWSR